MKFTKLEIPDLIYIEPDLFTDKRGTFFEAYHRDKFYHAGITVTFVQDNQSISQKGTLRGLHYQMPPKAQGKLIQILSGTIYDVAVDIRKGSAFYKKWIGQILSDKKYDMLYIPPGFAHGFYVLSDQASMAYKCTDIYSPEHEKTIRWDDPALGIEWPIAPNSPLRLSDKDKTAPLIQL